MMLEAPILWASIIAPPLLALAILGVSDASRARPLAYLLALVLAVPAVLVMAAYALGYLGEGIIDPLMIDLRESGVGTLVLFVDGLSGPVVLGVSIVTAIVAVYSLKYMAHRIEEMKERGESPPGIGVYYLLYAGFAASMLGMAYSGNLLLFFVFLELSLITSFLLIAYYGYGDRRRISLLYFVWTHIAGALLLAGALLYGINAGGFDAVTVSQGRIAYTSIPLQPVGAGLAAGLLVLVGLLVKMAVVGVHMWLPYAHAEAPTPVSALLSPNLVGLGAYGIVRFALPFFPDLMISLSSALLALGLLTIVYGGLVALKQADLKRFLAYSSVSQMGYLLVGIATLNPYGIAGALFFYLSHAIGKAVLFMTAGVFITELEGLRSIRDMGGLARAYPALAAASLIGFMHLAGIPPSFGFWGELLIVLGLVDSLGYSPAAKLAALAIILIIAFTVTAAYSFITMRRVFFGRPKYGNDKGLDEFKATVVLVALLGLFFFAVAGPLFGAAEASATALASLLS